MKITCFRVQMITKIFNYIFTSLNRKYIYSHQMEYYKSHNLSISVVSKFLILN